MNNDTKASILVGSIGCLALSVLCGGCVGGCALVSDLTYSEGYRDGYVRKLSHKGFVWQTWEGTMLIPRIKAGDKGMQMGEDWYFTAESESVAKEIEGVAADELVRLHYRQTWATVPWRGSTTYRVKKVEKVR